MLKFNKENEDDLSYSSEENNSKVDVGIDCNSRPVINRLYSKVKVE